MNIVGPRPERPTIFAELREPHRRVPAAPAGQAGHHRAGPDQPPLRPLDRRRAHQGELRPRVHPPPEPARRPAHHAQDHPRRPPPPRRVVSGTPGAAAQLLRVSRTPARCAIRQARAPTDSRQAKTFSNTELCCYHRPARRGTGIAGSTASMRVFPMRGKPVTEGPCSPSCPSSLRSTTSPRTSQPLVDWILEALGAYPATYEVILVDDGSRDDTWGRIAQAAAAHPTVHGLRLGRNVGQTAAMMAGFDHARGRVVVSLTATCRTIPATFRCWWRSWTRATTWCAAGGSAARTS